MANFTKRKGKWRAIIRRQGVNKCATFNTRAAAEQWAKEVESLIRSEEHNSVFQISVKNLDTNFRKLKERAGLKEADLHFHDPRREALTRLAQKFTVMELAKISGHRDLSILQNTYYAPDILSLAGKL